MRGVEGGQALGVEAGDQVGDGVAGPAADGAGGVLVVVAVGDQEEQVARVTSAAGAVRDRLRRVRSRRSSSVSWRSGSFWRRDMRAPPG